MRTQTQRFGALAVAGSVAVFGAAAMCEDAAAQAAIQWRVEDGGNGHWYAVAVNPAGEVHWRFDEAQSQAVGRGAHLATFASLAENTNVYSRLSIGSGYFAGWIGLRQAPGSAEPAGGWGWVTGEPLSFTHWQSGNPNNAGCYQPSAPQHWGTVEGSQTGGDTQGRWDDDGDPAPACQSHVAQAVIEWSADCNSDGIVDYGQCQNGSLADANDNNIPDCCESGDPCMAGTDPVQWRVRDGGNGHWYGVNLAWLAWDDARMFAESVGGHLATVSNAAEHDVVADRTSVQYQDYWLGARRSDTSCSPPCLAWITGEPWTFEVWAETDSSGCSAPNPNACGWNGPGTGTALEIYGRPDIIGHRKWNDEAPDLYYRGSIIGNPSIIEWSADCNADGIVDYGQILSGQLADTDQNGVPDSCQGSVTVPGDYATIQAAIDATPAGAHRLVSVAAGTYAGPIVYGGRDVVVRGAGAGKTIIAGTGGAVTSVVRFTGGEPATAALEGVTVSGGLTGWPFPDLPSALAGGGVMSFESAASLRDCIIEDNDAGFGGGAYFWFSTGDIERCIFRNNNASTDGGGLQIFGGSVAVVDSTLELNRCNSRGGGMHLVHGTTTLAGTAVRTNHSNNVVGGISWVPLGSASAYLTLSNCDVTGNTAVKTMGGIGVVDSGAITMSLAGTTVCTNTPLPNISGQWLSLGGNNVCVCAGDIVMDGVVDGVDLASLLGQWGTPGTANNSADTNHDGIVNGVDLAQVLSGWGACQ